MVRAVDEDLGLADALEQRVVLVGRRGLGVGRAHRGDERRPTAPRGCAPRSGAAVDARPANCAAAARRRAARARGARAGRRARRARAPRRRRRRRRRSAAVRHRGYRSSIRTSSVAVDVDDAAVAAHLQPLGRGALERGVAGELGRSSPRSRAACRTACRSGRSRTARLVQHARLAARAAAVGEQQPRLERDRVLGAGASRTGRTGRSSSR